ncbi:MAG: hypothetical protein R3B09_05690 [Nannocystaceae bacterium]
MVDHLLGEAAVLARAPTPALVVEARELGEGAGVLRIGGEGLLQHALGGDEGRLAAAYDVAGPERRREVVARGHEAGVELDRPGEGRERGRLFAAAPGEDAEVVAGRGGRGATSTTSW